MINIILIWILAIIFTVVTLYFGMQHYIFRIYPGMLINTLLLITIILWSYLLLENLVNLILNDVYYQVLTFLVILAYILFMPRDKKNNKKGVKK
jgi:hypothetical protein